MAIQIYEFNLDHQQKELEVRGTPMFPCSAYMSDIINNVTKDIPWHWHEDIEVVVIKKGSIQIGIDGDYICLNEGDGIFINSNTLHAAKVMGEGEYLLNSLVFHPSLIFGFVESIFEQKYVRPLINCDKLSSIVFDRYESWHQEAISCIENAYEAYEKFDYGYELVVRENLSHLWYLIVKYNEQYLVDAVKPENIDTIRIKQMMNYLHQYYDKSIDLAQIAAVANISERECLRCFNKTIGMTPIQYLLNYRISVAARLLVDTHLSIVDICHETGFDSPSYFSKIFKRALNCTPTQYRKQKDKDR